MVDGVAAMPAQRRIVVAGEMLELGPAAEDMHRAAGKHVAEKKIDVLVGVRGMAHAMVDGATQAGTRAEFLATPEEAGEWLALARRHGGGGLVEGAERRAQEKALEIWNARPDGKPSVSSRK